MNRNEFERYTEDLAIGKQIRAKHCGDSASMIVSANKDGYHAYCFRCGEHGWISNQLSINERIQLREEAKLAARNACASIDLPTPIITDTSQWPLEARVWLYKAGLNNDDIHEHGIYWCPDLQRVIMPVYNDRCVVYWQGRGLYNWQVKYINPKVNRDALVAKYSVGRGDTVVLTEDILSAIKVSKVTESWALMGTRLTDSVLSQLLNYGKRVIVMLDPDEAGRTAGRTILKRVLPVLPDTVLADNHKDPKNLTLQEINNVIRHDTIKTS